MGLSANIGLVGEIHGRGKKIADMGGALVLEEGARAVSPQRIRVVRRRLRLRHRHLHRLVAGLRRRIFDRGQRGPLAERCKPVERGAAAPKGGTREQRCGEGNAIELMQDGHELYSAFRGTGADSLAATETGAVGSAAPVVMGAGRGGAIATDTWPRPTTIPDTVRL